MTTGARPATRASRTSPTGVSLASLGFHGLALIGLAGCGARALGEITRRSHTTGSLCDALGSALTSLIDPGLYVSSAADASSRCRGEEGTAGGIEHAGVRLGEGIATGPAALALRVDPEGERVAILGVRALAPSTDPSGSGADEILREALSARALVIDLRGARSRPRVGARRIARASRISSSARCPTARACRARRASRRWQPRIDSGSTFRSRLASRCETPRSSSTSPRRRP